MERDGKTPSGPEKNKSSRYNQIYFRAIDATMVRKKGKRTITDNMRIDVLHPFTPITSPQYERVLM